MPNKIGKRVKFILRPSNPVSIFLPSSWTVAIMGVKSHSVLSSVFAIILI